MNRKLRDKINASSSTDVVPISHQQASALLRAAGSSTTEFFRSARGFGIGEFGLDFGGKLKHNGVAWFIRSYGCKIR